MITLTNKPIFSQTSRVFENNKKNKYKWQAKRIHPVTLSTGFMKEDIRAKKTMFSLVEEKA